MTGDSVREILANAGSEEHRRLALERLAKHKAPTYGSDPARPGIIIERRPDGTSRRGRMVARKFVETP